MLPRARRAAARDRAGASDRAAGAAAAAGRRAAPRRRLRARARVAPSRPRPPPRRGPVRRAPRRAARARCVRSRRRRADPAAAPGRARTRPAPHPSGGALPRSPHADGAPGRPGMGRRPGRAPDVARCPGVPRRRVPGRPPAPRKRTTAQTADRRRRRKEERPVYTGPAPQDHPHRRRHGEGAGREDGGRQEPRHHEGAHRARHHGHRQPDPRPAARDRDLPRSSATRPRSSRFEEEVVQEQTAESKPEDLVPRAPVVTVMGHVDHGKTSLLDAIRDDDAWPRARPAASPSTSARTTWTWATRKVVFLDTPGHEAFTLMRARGAKVTDVVVLVVAADDGVMPQTVEAMDHAKAAGVPIVVAVNKIDKPDAQPDRVKQQLSDRGLMPEEWGGTTVFVNVSAKKKQNLEQLLEMLLLVADLQELKANPKKAGRRAPCSRRGSTRGAARWPPSSSRTARCTWATPSSRARSPARCAPSWTTTAQRLKEAGPSTPVEILGLRRAARAGRPAPGRHRQREGAVDRRLPPAQAAREGDGRHAPRSSSRTSARAIAEGQLKELPLVVKADVQGSVEAVTDQLMKMPAGEDQAAHHPLRRGRHQRGRRAAGRGLQRGRDRLQRAARAQGRRGRRARQGGDAPLHRHLRRRRGDEEGHGGPARADHPRGAAGRGRGARQPSGSPRSARSPAATSPTARSTATRRCACCATTSSSTPARSSSLKRFKDDATEVKVGPRVRHRHRRLQRHQARRRDRVLHDREGQGDAGVAPRTTRARERCPWTCILSGAVR